MNLAGAFSENPQPTNGLKSATPSKPHDFRLPLLPAGREGRGEEIIRVQGTKL
jgi:hypothetical protein